jgi:hypothetical protein
MRFNWKNVLLKDCFISFPALRRTFYIKTEKMLYVLELIAKEFHFKKRVCITYFVSSST